MTDFNKTDYKIKPILSNIEIGLISISAIVFLILIANTFKPPFYDEDEYLSNVHILNQHGLGSAYLLNLIGSAGPLFSVIHYIFQPLTQLEAPYVRFVNYAFLISTIYVVGQILKTINTTTWTYSMYIMAIPLTYVMAGLALTEMPAIFFFSIAIYAALKAKDTTTNNLLYAALGGLCLSLAILGRQPYLLTLAAFPILFFSFENIKKSIILLSTFSIFSLALPLLVFWVWKGFVPPEDGTLYADIAKAGTSFQTIHIFNFLFYAVIAVFFIAPDFFKQLNVKTIWILVAIQIILVVVNLYTSFFLFLPIKTILRNIFPAPLIAFGEYFFGAAVVTAGVAFIILMLQTLKHFQYKKEVVFAVAAIILLAISCGKITWGFSSRYASQAIPLLLILGSCFYRKTNWNIARIAVGITIGLVSITFLYLGKQ
ncbi:MAG: hypothetical protein H7Y07_02465 [Pyrinomonadaceae bacterium]|nr:hypothetical protein [Sphingobacteriaceae bacterium]